MLYGCIPFKADDIESLQILISEGKYTMAEDISLEARDLIKHLLDTNLKIRYDFSSIVRHRWFEVYREDLEIFNFNEKMALINEFKYHKENDDD